MAWLLPLRLATGRNRRYARHLLRALLCGWRLLLPWLRGWRLALTHLLLLLRLLLLRPLMPMLLTWSLR